MKSSIVSKKDNFKRRKDSDDDLFSESLNNKINNNNKNTNKFNSKISAEKLENDNLTNENSFFKKENSDL